MYLNPGSFDKLCYSGCNPWLLAMKNQKSSISQGCVGVYLAKKKTSLMYIKLLHPTLWWHCAIHWATAVLSPSAIALPSRRPLRHWHCPSPPGRCWEHHTLSRRCWEYHTLRLAVRVWCSQRTLRVSYSQCCRLRVWCSQCEGTIASWLSGHTRARAALRVSYSQQAGLRLSYSQCMCRAHGNNLYGYGGEVLKIWYLKITKVHIFKSI